MNVKIDTKEIFHVISLNDEILSANMAEDLTSLVAETYKADNKSVVLNLESVKQIDEMIADAISSIHQEIYSHKKSFVICGLTQSVKTVFQNKDLIDTLNITPTESEAWDIVQMEEIERELDMDV